YAGIKAGDNDLVDIKVYLINNDNLVVDFNYPELTNWNTSYEVLPEAVSNSSLAVIDGYIYLFGGHSTDKIFNASVGDPGRWIDTQSTLPTKLHSSSLALVDGYVYLFGGNDGYSSVKTIMSASVN